MDRSAADTVTRALLAQIHRELQEAVSVAEAAEVCAASGNVQAAIKIVMDIEDPAYRADRMLKAALLIRNELLGEEPD
jgi:cation transport regulator ChaC